MNLLVSVTYYYPHVSGLTAHAQMIAEALAQQGHHVTVLCFRHRSRLPPRARHQGVNIIRAQPLFRLNKGFFSLTWFFHLLCRLPSAQGVILHLPQFEGFLAALLARLQGKRLVVFYHCDLVLPPGLGSRIIAFCLRLSHTLTLRLAHTIIHSTHDYAAHSSLLKPFASKLVFTYPPIKTYPSNPAALRRLAQRFRPHQEKLIGFCGRLAADKGVDVLLHALSDLKRALPPHSFKLLLAGPTQPVGEQSYVQTLHQLIHQNPDLIHLVGLLPDSDMTAFYQLLDVLVLPSVNATESFGTVQVEAMLAGTPVVASNLPGVRVPIERTGMGLLVPPRNSTALAQTILTVLRHPDRYRHPQVKLNQEFSFTQTLATYKHSLRLA